VTVNSRVFDFLIAVIVAALIVIVISGVATVGLVALLVLAACGVSVLIDRRRARHSKRPRRRRAR
jgi:Flp pilus assembly protein TadB